VRAASSALGGKGGGGRPDLAQAGRHRGLTKRRAVVPGLDPGIGGARGLAAGRLPIRLLRA